MNMKERTVLAVGLANAISAVVEHPETRIALFVLMVLMLAFKE